MEGLVVGILARLGGWGIAAGLVFSVAFWVFSDIHRQAHRGWWVAQLRHNSFARRYRGQIAALVSAVDRALGVPVQGVREAGLGRAGFALPEPAMALCLRLGFYLTGCSMLLVLVLTGQGSRLAGIEIVPEGVPIVHRYVYALLLAGSVLAAVGLRRIGRFWLRAAVRLLALVVLFNLRMLADVMFLGGRQSIAFSVLTVCFGFLALSLRRVEAILLLLPVAIYHLLLPVQIAIYLAFWWARRRMPGPWALLGFAAVTAAVFGAAATFLKVTPAEMIEALPRLEARYGIALAREDVWLWAVVADFGLFSLAFAPITLAVIGYAALTVSRDLMRRSVAGPIVPLAAADLAASCALVTALLVLVVWQVEITGLVTGAHADFGIALFDDLARHPDSYLWFAVAPAALLAPSLLHVALGLFSAFTLALRGAGGRLGDAIQSGDEVSGRLAGLALSVIATASVCLPAFALTKVVGAVPILLLALAGLARLV